MISIIAPANRSEFWQNIYTSLMFNTVDFEIVFVGDRKPEYDLPSNFRYIHSNVKPAQCMEIAFRESKGDLIHWTADDSFYDYERLNNLDNLYTFYKMFNDNKLIAAFTPKESNGDDFKITIDNHLMLAPNTPITQGKVMACWGLVSRKLVYDVGGFVDRNFIAGQWENDLCMRIYSYGGRVEFCPDAIVAAYHALVHVGGLDNTNFRKWYTPGRKYFEDCWFDSTGNLSPVRLKPFEPFSDENIKEITQGPKGQWQ